MGPGLSFKEGIRRVQFIGLEQCGRLLNDVSESIRSVERQGNYINNSVDCQREMMYNLITIEGGDYDGCDGD